MSSAAPLEALALAAAGDVAPWAALAALGSGLTWALGSLLFGRILGGDSGPDVPTAAAANFFKNLLATLVFLAAFPFLDVAWPAPDAWPWLLVSGAFGFAIGDTLYFAALPRAGVQASAMIGLVHVPGTVLLAWIFTGERLALATSGFMLVVVAGVVIVLREPPRPGAPSARVSTPNVRRIGVMCALAGALSQSIGVVVGHRGMDGASLLGGTLVRMFGGLVAALAGAIVLDVVRARRERAVVDLLRPVVTTRMWSGLIVAALFGSVIGLPLFHFALRDLPRSVASVLFCTTPLFTLPLGRFFGERHGLVALAGTLIGFAGVAGLVWSLTAFV